jgi:hypothetical protein
MAFGTYEVEAQIPKQTKINCGIARATCLRHMENPQMTRHVLYNISLKDWKLLETKPIFGSSEN